MRELVIGMFVGAGLLCGRFLLAALIKHAVVRIGASMWGIKASVRILGWVPGVREDVWSGPWEVSWEVDSKNFEPKSTHTANLYRFLGKVAVEGIGSTKDGNQIPYGFVGNYSNSDAIISGEWFDRTHKTAGYHGTFQLRVPAAARNRGEGLWLGFSDNGPEIKSGKLIWTKKF